MRVGIIILKHESNTFLPRRTTLPDFHRDFLGTGPAITEHYRSAHHEAAGFFEGLAAENIDAVPLFAASATPSGMIEQSTYESLLQTLLEQLSNAGPLDGLLISAHGAAVAEHLPDMDGHWLAGVRQAVGPNRPIICTIDPHANLSPAMVTATTALIPYRTNPHVDQKERGLEAASLIARTLRGEIHPTQAAAFPPVAINIASQNTNVPPCSTLLSMAAEQRRIPKVLNSGVVLGFPYSDVPEMGSSFIVVTDNDTPLAAKMANELADYLWEHRHDFVPQLPDIESAITLAEKSPVPVCLLDLGDNVGGGSPGDGTLIAHALLERNIRDALVCLCDPEAACKAIEAGLGAIIDLEIGGKSDGISPSPGNPGEGWGGGYSGVTEEKAGRNTQSGASPFSISSFPANPLPSPSPGLPVEGTRERFHRCRGFARSAAAGPPKVLSLHDGKFTETAIRHGGKRDYDMGQTAVVEANGLTILIHSLRTPPFSLNQILSCNLDPANFKIIIAKGVHAPLAAYAPVCKTFIHVDTPGVTTANMTMLPFRRRRRPLFPFEELET